MTIQTTYKSQDDSVKTTIELLKRAALDVSKGNCEELFLVTQTQGDLNVTLAGKEPLTILMTLL